MSRFISGPKAQQVAVKLRDAADRHFKSDRSIDVLGVENSEVVDAYEPGSYFFEIMGGAHGRDIDWRCSVVVMENTDVYLDAMEGTIPADVLAYIAKHAKRLVA